MSGTDIDDFMDENDGYYRPTLGERIFVGFLIVLFIFTIAWLIYGAVYMATHW